jgi:hypothetical protein
LNGPVFFGPPKNAVPASLPVWIGVIALRVISRAAVGASSARNGRGDDGAISGLYIAYSFADLFNDADAFMTEDSAFLHTGHGATHEMQIGVADSAGVQTHNGVEIVLDRRLLDSIQSNISNTMENDGFYSFSPEESFGIIFCYRDARDLRALLAESGANRLR